MASSFGPDMSLYQSLDFLFLVGWRTEAKDGGVEHPKFQREHVARGVPEVKGHWKSFLCALASPDELLRPLTCRACLALRGSINKVSHSDELAQHIQQRPQPLEDIAKIQESEKLEAKRQLVAVPTTESECKLGPSVHKPGRPKAGDQRWRLGIFIQQKRSDVYLQTAESGTASATYFCQACSRKKKFGSHTCKKKLDDHERSKKHRQGLRRLGIPWSGSEGEDADQSEAEVENNSDKDPDAGADLAMASTEYKCQGVPCSDKTFPLHALNASVFNFVQSGQPRLATAGGEIDPLADAQFEYSCDKVSVRSRKCQVHCRRVDVACTECAALTRKKAFQCAIATRSYQVDLARYAHKVFHAQEEELKMVVSEIQNRDYMNLGLAGSDFTEILSMPSKLDQVRRIRRRFVHIPAWRLTPSFQAFMENWLPKTPDYHSSDMQAQAHASLVTALGEGVARGRVRQLDLKLASQVACGALRSDSLVSSLVTTFLQTLEASWKNSRRKTSGAFVDQDALIDAVQTLGRGPELQSMLQRFRINPNMVPRINLTSPGLPDSFVALRDTNVLVENFQKVQSLLKACSRRLHIVVDETTWAASYQQARLFRDGQDRIIGGAWYPDGSADWSCLRPEDHPLAKLPQEHLAKTSLHFVAHRVDTARFVYECCCLPTKTVIGCSDTMLRILADVLEACTKANSGTPPSGCAFDGCTSNTKILKIFIGLLPEKEWVDLPFFRDCTLSYPKKIKYFPYGCLRHRGNLLVSFHGAFHLQKRFSLQVLSGARKVRFAGFFVDLASQLQQNLPVRAFVAQNVQSDRDAAQRMSPPFLSRSWSGVGQHIHALIAALLASATTASLGFSKREHALNGLAAFYLLTLHVAYNESMGRGATETLHPTTVRNACSLAASIVACCQTPLEPRGVQEIAVEEHFSRIKAPFRGQPTLRDGQYGLVRVHAKQCKLLETETDETLSASQSCQCREPLSEDELAKLAQSALASAVQYFSMHCVDETTDELTFKFFRWWRDRRDGFFRTWSSEGSAECEEDEILPEVECDLEGQTADPLQAENFQVLQAVQDRAMVVEELQELLSEDKAPAPATPHVEESSAIPPHEELVPPEAGENDVIPKTLQEIVSKSLRKPEFSKYVVGESGGVGPYAALKRAQLTIGPTRQFVRLVRLEEKFLSQALLENRRTDLNAFNEREAELAAARRAANVCAQRTSRAAAWQKATEKVVASAVQVQAGDDRGLSAVQSFRNLDDRNPQIIVFQRHGVDSELGLAVVLTVFRGSLTKQGEKLVVRTSKPAAADLPASSTRKVHVAVLEKDESSHSWFASGLSHVLLLDPVNSIFAEVRAECKVTQTRLHVRLDETTSEEIRLLGKRQLPHIDKPVPEVAVAGRVMTKEMQFNDRSFMRSALEAECRKFFGGLVDLYAAKGVGFVKDGYVQVAKGRTLKWEDLLARIPGFFLSGFKNQKGYAFSKAVYQHLIPLLPDTGGFSDQSVYVCLQTCEKA